MKLLTTALAATAAFAGTSFAEAGEVTFTTTLKSYSGDGAYVVIYLTDAAGAYQGTIWMAGGKTKYYRHLSDWKAASGGGKAEVNGITGASVGSGETLTVTANLADQLIDAGYVIHIDSAVEDQREYPSEVMAPLTAAGNGKAVAGSGYVDSFTYSF